MEGKVKLWTGKIKASCLGRFAAILALPTTIWATLSYPLAAITLTKRECEHIVIPIFKTILPRMGINRHIAKCYRYGPKKYHGLGLRNLYTDQGVEQLKMLLRHGGTKSQCGILIQCCYEALQLEVGSQQPLFDLDYETFEALCTESYLKTVWKYVQEHKIKVTAPITIPKPARVNDVAIADAMMKHKSKFSDKEILVIKRCRMYMQVYYLSDITTGNGKQITEAAYKCKRDEFKQSNLKWQYQPKPTSWMIEIWQKMLYMVFIRFGTALEKPLKEWNERSHITYSVQVDLTETTAFIKTG